MTTTTKLETRLESPSPAEHRGDGLGNFGLIHLAACLGVGTAAVLAVNLIEWLT